MYVGYFIRDRGFGVFLGFFRFRAFFAGGLSDCIFFAGAFLVCVFLLRVLFAGSALCAEDPGSQIREVYNRSAYGTRLSATRHPSQIEIDNSFRAVPD